MSINKNFVVKNGLEVSTDLILANDVTNKVGIATINPQYTLHVNGGIGATDLYVTGVGTVSSLSATTLSATNGSITNISGTNLSYSGIGTLGSFYIGGNQVVSSARELQNIVSLDSTTTATIEAAIANGPNTFTDLNVTGITTLAVTGITTLNVSGIATLGNVQISSGIITASSGIVTYYGDGTKLSLSGNPDLVTSTGIGIGTTGGLVGYGITFINFYGTGVSTSVYNSGVGIATIFFEGGGSGTIGIGTEFPINPSSGDLFYSAELARLFVYYDEVTLGIGSTAVWVDAAPSSVGIISTVSYISVDPNTASSPSISFTGDLQTGFFSPGSGEFTIVSTGSSVLNVNASGINVTGVATASSFSGPLENTLTLNTSGVGISGSTTFNNSGASTFTVASNATSDNSNDTIVSRNGSGGFAAGIITATDFDSLSDINYKENVTTVSSAVSKVEQLRGVKFDWKESGLPSYGVIAQELEEVLPELVHGDNPKTVNYNGIIGVLIEAIKELKNEIEEIRGV